MRRRSHQARVEEGKANWRVGPVLRARVFSSGLILGLAFLLLVSLLVSTALAAFDGWFGRH